MNTYNNKMITTTSTDLQVGNSCDCLEGIVNNTSNSGKSFCGCDKSNFCPAAKYICKKDGSKANESNGTKDTYLPAYVDTIHSSTEVAGTQIADLIKVSSANSKYSIVYRNCNGLATALPNINKQATFHVETSYAVVKSATLSRELNNADFVVNNVVPVSDSVVMTGVCSFNVPLAAYNPQIFRNQNIASDMGSKGAVIIASSGVAVTYMLEYVLCGYVSTDEGTYSFEMTLTDTSPKTSTNLTSFYLPETSIPENAIGETTFLKVNFSFDANLISPVVTIDSDDTVCFCDTIIITPKAVVETIVNKKVMLAVESSEK